MRIVLAACLVLYAAYVYCEQCTTNQNCKDNPKTGCSSGWEEICQHPNTTQGIVNGGGLCTCRERNTTCTVKADCKMDMCAQNRRLHCVDNRCICSRW